MKVDRFFLVLLLFAGCWLSSCVKDNFEFDKLSKDVEYTGSFALPVAYCDVALYEAMNILDTAGTLIDNRDGYLSISYKSYVESRPVQDLLNISDQMFSQTISLSDVTRRGIKSDTVISYTRDIIFPFEMFNSDAEIDSMILKTGTFNFDVNTSFGRSTKLVVEFPSMTKNGQYFRDSASFMPSDMLSQKTCDLAGYKLNFTSTTLGYNEIPVRIKLYVYYSTSNPPTSGEISTSVRLSDFSYSLMYGYFGYNELFFQSDTIKIDMFKQNQAYDMERFYFNDPRLDVHYWNSYGVPSMFYFTELDAHLRTTNQIVDVTSSSPDFPMSESNPYLVANAEYYGHESLDSVTLNKTNSNLDEIVPNRPSWIHFKARAATNPAGRNHGNFISENSCIRSKINVEFPLWGYVYNFHYNDTVDLNLSDFVNKYPVDRLALLLTVENGLPAEAFAQFYLVDDNYVILDSLIDNGNSMVLEAASINTEGHVISRSTKQTKVEVTMSQLESMSRTKHLIMSVRANTNDAVGNKLVKIYRDYGIKAHVGVEADLNGSINEFGSSFGDQNGGDGQN